MVCFRYVMNLNDFTRINNTGVLPLNNVDYLNTMSSYIHTNFSCPESCMLSKLISHTGASLVCEFSYTDALHYGKAIYGTAQM